MRPGNRRDPQRHAGQRGIVLFVALIAMVSIMLAAVGMLRSADTATLIAGNLAFRQTATSAGDLGMEQAINWLRTQNALNPGDPKVLAGHYFNSSKPTVGYYSYVNPDANFLKSDATWAEGKSQSVGTDVRGNQVRYVVERMCRVENIPLSDSNCLYSDSSSDGNEQKSGSYEQLSGKSPMIRITVRVVGPRNTLAYVQGFAY